MADRESQWFMQETKAEEEEGKGQCRDPSAATGENMRERKRKSRGRPERKEERKTASIFAGGTISESGCDGLSASTEPDEGVLELHLEAAPPSTQCF